jgi:hypothetical protein
MKPDDECLDCQSPRPSRRDFIKSTAVTTASLLGAGTISGSLLRAEEPSKPKVAQTSESLVKVLYESLSPKQKEDLCHEWDYQDPKRRLLRTFVANNWDINKHFLNDEDYFNNDQRQIVRDIYKGMLQPEWVKRIDKQLEDDSGGFGAQQSFAIFGKPGSDKFQFVMTGRHLTMRCDGNSTEHMAFGGPIFYGHAADGFNEKPDHPGNIFWPQAIAANGVYKLLDDKQRKGAMVPQLPREQGVAFQGKDGKFPGLPVTEMSKDQQAELQKLLAALIEPYRQSDRDEALTCLKTQGGLEKCSLAFYAAGDLGNDQVWDNWRLEGPSFVWYFRGTPHVHVWVNVADDASVKLNA